jgi:hypothetical protein
MSSLQPCTSGIEREMTKLLVDETEKCTTNPIASLSEPEPGCRSLLVDHQ